MGISWDYKIRFDETKKALSEKRFFENLKKIIESDINIAISITVQKYLLEINPIELIEKFDGVKSIDFELLTIFDEKTQNIKISNVKWAKYLKDIVDFYLANNTTWSLPQVDLFTKSILENKLYRCKCDCCNNRTFTLNPNGSVGLCPDKTYFEPLVTASELYNNWSLFEEKALPVIALRESLKVNDVCLKCEFYDICGGNCEKSLFVEGEDECPLSKSVVKFQLENIDLFKKKLEKAYDNLPEL
jgi:radical SAM protein with 4Fe4S-binding SPASM domain